MTEKKFEIKKAISFGWQKMCGNVGSLLLFIILPGFIISVIGNGVPIILKLMHLDKSPIYFISSLLIMLLYIFYGMVVIKICLEYYDNQKPSKQDFIPKGTMLVNYICTRILFMVMVGLGLICLIVPGILIALRFQFCSYLVVDKGLGPIQALKASSRITQGASLDLVGLWFMYWLISLAGLLCLIIGIIPATLIVYLAMVYVYRQCLNKSDISDIVATV